MHIETARVVVTGGAGFIGSHLVDRLLMAGALVHVIDDFSNGATDNLRPNPNLAITGLELRADSARELADVFDGANLVFHLASPMGVKRAHCEPDVTLSSIVGAGRAVTEACMLTRTPVLFTSSSEVYGARAPGRVGEDARIGLGPQPRWSYATGKLRVETLLTSLTPAVDSWIVRLFNVVGARQSPDNGHVLPSFCHAALRDAPLLVHGDGRATRTFLHVDDAIDALLAVAESPRLVGQPVNVGGSDPIRISQLARLVIKQANSASTIEFVDEETIFDGRFVPVRTRIPDTRRMRSFTGWQPRRPLGDAVTDCLAYVSRSLAPKP